MEEMETVCRRVWHIDDGSGGRREFVVAVGRAQPDGDDWYCPLVIDGRSRRIFGVDSWQAVTLSIRFILGEVAELERQGMQLYWPDGTAVKSGDF